MTDLHARIGAALDREQAQAEAALPQWDLMGGSIPFAAPSRYIAAQDPARTLRRVEADRRVLARHSPYHWCVPCEGQGSWREVCADLVDLAARCDVDAE